MSEEYFKVIISVLLHTGARGSKPSVHTVALESLEPVCAGAAIKTRVRLTVVVIWKQTDRNQVSPKDSSLIYSKQSVS